MPADVWDIEALKKALKKALDGIYDVYDAEEKFKEDESDARLVRDEGKYAKATLTHVLNCWADNITWIPEIRRQQSSGPFCLMHILRGRYGDPARSVDFSSLERPDRKFLDAVLEACATTAHPFHIFLARFSRRAHRRCTSIRDPDDGTPVEVLTVEKSDCWLHDIVHAAGSEIKINPKVSEDDLVDEWYFEGKQPDGYVFEGKVAGHVWERAVVILAPHDFADEFLGYPADDLDEGLVWLDDVGRWVALDEDLFDCGEGKENGFVKFSTEGYPANFRVDEDAPTFEYISMQGRLSDREQESEDEEESEVEDLDDGEISGYIRSATGPTPQMTRGDNIISPFPRMPLENEGQPDPREAAQDEGDDDRDDGNEDVYVEDEDAMIELALQELAEYQATCKDKQDESCQSKG